LEGTAYENRSKKREQDFSRERKMPFKKLIWFMLGTVKESSQNALERFFPKIKETAHMSRQAFSMARQKVKREAFRELFQASAEGSYNEELKDWRGYLLMAVDGSRIALPPDEALRKYYGVIGNEKTVATARMSILYDIENDIIADAKIEPISKDERGLAKEHINALAETGSRLGGRKAIVIFDRGYPSKDLIGYLGNKGIKYVMRVQRGFNSRIDLISAGSEVIKLSEEICVRAVVFELSNGEREALITNLGEEEAEEAVFPGLYYKRWPIETKYNQVKQKLELENFSGRLADNIKQDFYAMMTVSNMPACAMREANREINMEGVGKERLYEYRANANHAVGVLKDRLIGIVIAEKRFVRLRLYRELVSEIKRRIVPIRPNRKTPRKEYPKKPHFHHNHKSNC
jgi:hypothetical protein